MYYDAEGKKALITTIKNGKVIVDGKISVRDISFMDGKIVSNPLVPDRIIDATPQNRKISSWAA